MICKATRSATVTRCFKNNLRKIFSNPLIYVAVLTGAVFICFGRTLGSYFLADDFGEVAYVAKIFDGDWPRLWSNFTGNYMQVPSMAVYRPWLLMTLFFDFAVWKTNAAGYYFTNVLHYLACTILIFTLIRMLTSYWGRLRSNLAATFSGLLFATHPLHCESVSWVVGRVDIVCLTYYLLGLVSVALYVRNLNKRWLILTFACFWLGILTKEMAIALPVTATLLAFLWGNSKALKEKNSSEKSQEKVLKPKSGNDLNFDPLSPHAPQPSSQVISTEPSRASAIAALQKLDHELHPHASPAQSLSEGELVDTTSEITSPDYAVSIAAPPLLSQRFAAAFPVGTMLFACTVIYFIIRYACLGTITGGYTGSIGSSQFSGILQKWTDLDTVMRIVFPLNQFVFGDGAAQKNLLSGIYLLLIALATTRLVIGSLPRRWLLFIFVSSITALAPIYQLWGIGYELEGSRFVFFLTVSLSMLFPIILFSPLQKIPDTTSQPPVSETPPPKAAPSKQAEIKPAQQANIRLMVLSVVALTSLTMVFARLTLRNNIPWVHAGKQTESIHEKAATLSKSTPAGKLVGVVGIPKDEGGAHMILNGTTFRHLITPPFAEPGLTGKILTFEPSLFGDADKIDTAHFKEALSRPDVASFLVWDMDQKDFVSFNPGTPAAIPQPISISLLGPASNAPVGTLQNGPVASYPYTQGRGDIGKNGLIANAESGLGIRISGLHLRPAQFDYVVIKTHSPSQAIVTTVATASAEKKSLFRTNTSKVQIESSTNEKTLLNVRLSEKFTELADGSTRVEVRLPVSAYWRYFCAGEITGMVIDLPALNSSGASEQKGRSALAIDSVDLLPASLIAPDVSVLERTSADDGAFTIDRRKRADASVRIAVDATKLQETSAIEMQILHKNFFFDNLKSEAALVSGTNKVLRAAGNKTTFVIPDEIVKSSGYVQLRLRCVDRRNQQVGEYSFPITLKVVANQL